MKTKKILALVLAVVMVLAMAAPALADDLDDGSITITNATKDTAYSIVKIFDLEYDDTVEGDPAVSYTFTTDGTAGSAKETILAALKNGVEDPASKTDPKDKIASPFALTQVSGTNTYVVELKEGMEATNISAFLNALLTTETTVDGKTTRSLKDTFTATDSATASADGKVTFSGLEYGYYYVVSSLGSTVTIDSTLKAVNVVDKNQKPDDFDKVIVTGQDEDGKDIETRVSEANAGEAVNFKLTVNATQYDGAEYIDNYLIYDNIDEECFTIDYNSIKVFVNGTEIDKNDDYIVNQNVDLDDDKKVDYEFVIQVFWGYTFTEGTGDDARTYVAFRYDDPNAEIKVTYDAIVNEGVKVDQGMENKATFNFTSKSTPETPDTPPEEEHEVPEGTPVTEIPKPTNLEKTTYTFSTELKIFKYTMVNSAQTALGGAKFEVTGESKGVALTNEEIFVESKTGTYYRLKNGSYTETAPIKEDTYTTPWDSTKNTNREAWIKVDGVWKAATDDQIADKANADKLFLKTLPNVDLYDGITPNYEKKTQITIDMAKNAKKIDEIGYTAADGESKGYMTVKGLGVGDYTITELEAPDGYNKLTEPIYVKIVFEPMDAEGNVVAADSKIIDHWGLNAYEATKPAEGEFVIKTDSEGNEVRLTGNTKEVLNNKGTELPSTGGIGTKIFITVGALAMIGAGLFFVTNQRMRKEGY